MLLYLEPGNRVDASPFLFPFPNLYSPSFLIKTPWSWRKFPICLFHPPLLSATISSVTEDNPSSNRFVSYPSLVTFTVVSPTSWFLWSSFSLDLLFCSNYSWHLVHSQKCSSLDNTLSLSPLDDPYIILLSLFHFYPLSSLPHYS